MANYVFNSSSSGEKYNAKCLNVSDDSEWTPSAAEYPQDGTIDLSGGTLGRYLDTQWEAPQDEEWTMSGIYNVVMGVSYDMYSIHYKGNQTCDIYLGSSTEDLTLSESNKDYTPPTGTWIIEEEPPSIIIPAPALGPDIFVNGDFTTDVSGWVPRTNVTLTWAVGGYGDVFNTLDTYTNEYVAPSVSPVLEAGKTYRITGNVLSIDNATEFRMYSTDSGFDPNIHTTPGIHTLDFVAVGGSTIVRFYVKTSNPGGGGYRLDYFRIQEVL